MTTLKEPHKLERNSALVTAGRRNSSILPCDHRLQNNPFNYNIIGVKNRQICYENATNTTRVSQEHGLRSASTDSQKNIYAFIRCQILIVFTFLWIFSSLLRTFSRRFVHYHNLCLRKMLTLTAVIELLTSGAAIAWRRPIRPAGIGRDPKSNTNQSYHKFIIKYVQKSYIFHNITHLMVAYL